MDLVKFVICTLASRVHMTFYILTKGHIVPGNQGTHDKLSQIQAFFRLSALLCCKDKSPKQKVLIMIVMPLFYNPQQLSNFFSDSFFMIKNSEIIYHSNFDYLKSEPLFAKIYNPIEFTLCWHYYNCKMIWGGHIDNCKVSSKND